MSAWTSREAAAFLGLKEKTIRSMAAEGLIPAAQVGRLWRFDQATLEEWLRTRCRANVKETTAPCPSVVARVPRISKSPSGSLATRLESQLAQLPAERPSSSRSSFALISGGKSN